MDNELSLAVEQPGALLESMLANDPRLRSEHTRRVYRIGVKAFNAWRAERPVSKSLVTEYMSQLLASGISPATVNVRLSAIKWYCRVVSDMAQDLGNDELLTDELAKKAARVTTVRALRQNHNLAGRLITQAEFTALLDACHQDRSIAGRRDASILSALWVSGMRRDEIAHIELADLTKIDAGYSVAIRHGKGDKPRTVYIQGGAGKYLTDWLEARGEEPGRVYYALDHRRNAPNRDRSMTGAGLAAMLAKRAAEAGIETVRLHDFRRSFASNLWDARIDGSTIQRLMGHASQSTTSAYDRRPLETQRAAAEVLHVPYQK